MSSPLQEAQEGQGDETEGAGEEMEGVEGPEAQIAAEARARADRAMTEEVFKDRLAWAVSWRCGRFPVAGAARHHPAAARWGAANLAAIVRTSPRHPHAPD
jgi:hypothetical protein